jgi:hypothetical protein
MVTCPRNATPGTKEPIVPPPPNLTELAGKYRKNASDHDQVEILVPQGINDRSEKIWMFTICPNAIRDFSNRYASQVLRMRILFSSQDCISAKEAPTP